MSYKKTIRKIPLKLSIIIPIYNSQAHLSKCLNSVNIASNTGLEIIIVNDGSKDSSIKICKKFISKNSNFRIINLKKNIGVGYARNVALKNVRGKYVMFLDSDDRILKGSLKDVISKLDEYPENEIFFIRSKFINKNEVDYNEIYESKNTQTTPIKLIRNYKNFRSTCWNLIVRKNSIKKHNIKFAKARIFEDHLFVANALCSLKKYRIIKKPVYEKREQDTNSLSKQSGLSALVSCSKILVDLINLLNKSGNLKSSFKFKFLITRINFITTQFLENILICSEEEIKKILHVFRSILLLQKISRKKPAISNFFSKTKSEFYTKLKIYRSKKISYLQKLDIKAKYIIFCTGIYSQIILKLCLKINLKIIFLLDNNKYYIGQKINGIIVKNPNILKKKSSKFKHIKILICNKNTKQFLSIKEQLLAMGIIKSSIVRVNF